MFDKKLSNGELSKFPYPNLIAEIIESHYSICTVSEYMGLGRCSEDDEQILGKLRGDIEILSTEALGLARLFGTDGEYLFSPTLKVLNGKPEAYLRWLDKNERRGREMKEYDALMEIERELRQKPYLLDFMKMTLKLSEYERKEVAEFLVTRTRNDNIVCTLEARSSAEKR